MKKYSFLCIVQKTSNYFNNHTSFILFAIFETPLNFIYKLCFYIFLLGFMCIAIYPLSVSLEDANKS